MKNKAKLLTIKQASKVVDGITEYRIRQMCISGESPCFKAGKKYLINETVLLQTVIGEVLYLALEDTHPRLKERLERIQGETEDTEKLHLVISSQGITDGLIEQIKTFIAIKPNTKLVVIDTLERIRNSEHDKSMYSCDYKDIGKLREALEGSTGLVGAVDGVWVLEKEKRTVGKLTTW